MCTCKKLAAFQSSQWWWFLSGCFHYNMWRYNLWLSKPNKSKWGGLPNQTDTINIRKLWREEQESDARFIIYCARQKQNKNKQTKLQTASSCDVLVWLMPCSLRFDSNGGKKTDDDGDGWQNATKKKKRRRRKKAVVRPVCLMSVRPVMWERGIAS